LDGIQGQDPDPDLSYSGSIILDTHWYFIFFHMTCGALPDTETEPETQTITRYLGMPIGFIMPFLIKGTVAPD
jgi:hypothetical protein